MWTYSFEVRTGNRPAVVNLTEQIAALVHDRGDGLLHIFVPHATAGLALIESGSGSEPDLLERLEHLLPPDAAYRHRHGAEGHGRDHLLPAFISPFLALAVHGGRLDLGTWQSICLVDTNVDNPVREVRLSFIESLRR